MPLGVPQRACDAGSAVKEGLGDAKECVANRGDCITDPIKQATATGYLDVNATVCLPPAIAPVCGTAGVQWQVGTLDFYPYAGGGAGVGIGASVQYAPGQTVSTGLNCAVQGSAWFVSGQGGYGGLHFDYEGKPKWTWFGEVGVGIGSTYASTCVYIAPSVRDWF